MPSQKYPGRDRVFHRDDVRDILWRRSVQAPPADPCERPIPIFAIGLPGMLEADRSPLPVEIEARCRKCDGCLRHRRRLWTARAVDEIDISQRTWFGTLTVAPEHRLRILWEAERKHLRRGGESLSSLSHAETFRLAADELGKEVTRWLKRLRKSGPLRYLLVFEAHKDGFPHVHLLIHEQEYMHRKAALEAQWRIGFSHWRLVEREPSAAIYVCKYLAKDALARVRASQSYGQRHKVAVAAERLQEATRCASEGVVQRSDEPVEERSEGEERSDERGEGHPSNLRGAPIDIG